MNNIVCKYISVTCRVSWIPSLDNSFLHFEIIQLKKRLKASEFWRTKIVTLTIYNSYFCTVWWCLIKPKVDFVHFVFSWEQKTENCIFLRFFDQSWASAESSRAVLEGSRSLGLELSLKFCNVLSWLWRSSFNLIKRKFCDRNTSYQFQTHFSKYHKEYVL